MVKEAHFDEYIPQELYKIDKKHFRLADNRLFSLKSVFMFIQKLHC